MLTGCNGAEIITRVAFRGGRGRGKREGGLNVASKSNGEHYQMPSFHIGDVGTGGGGGRDGACRREQDLS